MATCHEYKAIARELALSLRQPVSGAGTECDMPVEALRYYFKYTARFGAAAFGDWDFTEALGELAAPLVRDLRRR